MFSVPVNGHGIETNAGIHALLRGEQEREPTSEAIADGADSTGASGMRSYGPNAADMRRTKLP
jgi:hypothetical protein